MSAAKINYDRIARFIFNAGCVASGVNLAYTSARGIPADLALLNTWSDNPGGYFAGCRGDPKIALALNGVAVVLGSLQMGTRLAVGIRPAIRLAQDTCGVLTAQLKRQTRNLPTSTQALSPGDALYQRALEDSLMAVNACEASVSLLLHAIQGYRDYWGCNANGPEILVTAILIGVAMGSFIKSFIAYKGQKRFSLLAGTTASIESGQERQKIIKQAFDAGHQLGFFDRELANLTLGSGLLFFGIANWTSQSLSPFQLEQAAAFGTNPNTVNNFGYNAEGIALLACGAALLLNCVALSLQHINIKPRRMQLDSRMTEPYARLMFKPDAMREAAQPLTPQPAALGFRRPVLTLTASEKQAETLLKHGSSSAMSSQSDSASLSSQSSYGLIIEEIV